MADAHTQFVGSVPQKYDEHLGSLIFEPYGADLARRIAAPPGGTILEVACGTGISTQCLRSALPEDVAIVATDLSEPMLDHARAKRGGMANLSFEAADAADLPFEDERFDAVVCQFGMMFLPDKAAGMAEAARVLKPGGQLAFSVWDSFTWNPIAPIAERIINSFFESDPPTFIRTPFGFHEIDPWKDLLHGADFTDIVISVVPVTGESRSAQHAAVGLVEGNPSIGELHERGTAPPQTVIVAMTEALRDAFGDEPMRVPMQAIVITARRPAPRT